MCHAYNEKRKKTNKGRSRTTKLRIKSEYSKKKQTINSWKYWMRTVLSMRRGKKKIKKREYIKRTRKLLETKIHSRNLIKLMNNWAVSFVRYSGPFLMWLKVELKKCTREQEK